MPPSLAMTQSRLLFAPQAQQALCRGFNQLADLLEVALGPRGRLVAMAGDNPRKPPELLNDGALIARRFLGLPGRFETMGAFLARHIAWQVEEAVGDGSTTAVVIARQVLNEALRQVAAGHHAMDLRRGIERALPLLLQALRAQAQPLDAAPQIAALATTVTGDATLGRLLEEIFDTVGPYGAIQVRTSYSRSHERRYIQGTFWNQGWVSSTFTTDAGTAILKDPYLLFTTRSLTTAEELLPILNAVRTAGSAGLVVIAPGISGNALNLLVTNKVRGALPTLAIKAPGLGPEKEEILADLAVLCGGKLLRDETGERVERAMLADLGRADEVQAIRSGFTLIGGKGRPAAIRTRYQALQREAKAAQRGRDRDRLVERAGKLLGGVALLEVGGATELERDHLKERAKEAVDVVRVGLQGGIVPGGGVAYLRLLHTLDALPLADAEAAARPILRAALRAPAHAILRNAGLEPGPILSKVLACNGDGNQGYDVMRGEVVDVMAAHIVDPLPVVERALQAGISGALMALTTEVLVHRPRHNRDEAVDFAP